MRWRRVGRGGRVARDIIRDARRPQPPRIQPHVEARRRDANTNRYGAPEAPEPRERDGAFLLYRRRAPASRRGSAFSHSVVSLIHIRPATF